MQQDSQSSAGAAKSPRETFEKRANVGDEELLKRSLPKGKPNKNSAYVRIMV